MCLSNYQLIKVSTYQVLTYQSINLSSINLQRTLLLILHQDKGSNDHNMACKFNICQAIIEDLVLQVTGQLHRHEETA